MKITLNHNIEKRWKTRNGRKYLASIIENHHDEDKLKVLSEKYFGYVDDYIDLRGLPIIDTTLNNAQLSYCDLSYSWFEKSTLNHCEFDCSCMTSSTFKNANLISCSLIDSNCKYLTATSCTFKESSFNGSNFEKSELTNVLINQCDLMQTNFTKASMTELEFEGENWLKSSTLPLHIKDFVESNMKNKSFLERIKWI